MPIRSNEPVLGPEDDFKPLKPFGIDPLPPPPDPDIMRHFAYAHLPERLQAVSRPFGELARTIVDTIPDNEQRAVALQKLLEAKDAAVRAFL